MKLKPGAKILAPLWSILFLCLGPLAAVAQGQTFENIRYFQYWAQYGPAAQKPHEHQRLTWAVTKNRLYIYHGGAPSRKLDVKVDESAGRALAKTLAGLSLERWPGALENSDEIDNLPEKISNKSCLWQLHIVFEPKKASEPARELSWAGYDNGLNPKRLAAEQAFLAFFQRQYEIWRLKSPRQIKSLSWQSPEGPAWFLDRRDNGRLMLERSAGQQRLALAVDPKLLARLEQIINKHHLERWHGLGPQQAEKGAFNLYINFDNGEEIIIRGHEDKGTNPPGWDEAKAELLQSLSRAIEGPKGASAEPVSALCELSLASSGLTEGPLIEVYERMDAQGPVFVLSRSLGHGSVIQGQKIVGKEFLAELEALLTQYNVKSWHEFKGQSKLHVADGDSFSLSILFRDGSELQASGRLVYPPKFRDFQRDFNALADRELGPL